MLYFHPDIIPWGSSERSFIRWNVASQHTGVIHLACFKLRDSCITVISYTGVFLYFYDNYLSIAYRYAHFFALLWLMYSQNFFVEYILQSGGISNDLELTIFYYEHFSWNWPGNGCFFCFHGKRSEWTTYEQRACMHNCRSIWWISGTYASDWLGLRTHDRGVFSCIWKVYSMDCIDSSSCYWRKNADWRYKKWLRRRSICRQSRGTVCSGNCHFYRCVICWFYYRRI